MLRYCSKLAKNKSFETKLVSMPMLCTCNINAPRCCVPAMYMHLYSQSMHPLCCAGQSQGNLLIAGMQNIAARSWNRQFRAYRHTAPKSEQGVCDHRFAWWDHLSPQNAGPNAMPPNQEHTTAHMMEVWSSLPGGVWVDDASSADMRRLGSICCGRGGGGGYGGGAAMIGSRR